MAAPGARMRLTVLVEALAEENAHGEYRDMALAAFKERRFAMPVQLQDTFAAVWRDIEQRYKTNYLSRQQAAAFSIKKLQDAYDCDLDMTDTVGAIFEGEPDRKMHLIKVIPHFVYRETSVVPGSMLRPTGVQKRAADDADPDADPDDGASKRRRVESQQRQDTRLLSPNRPLPSTELQQAATLIDGDLRTARSRSGLSLLELGRNETGQPPFSSGNVKHESPEPRQQQPPPANALDAAAPNNAQHMAPIHDELPDVEAEDDEDDDDEDDEDDDQAGLQLLEDVQAAASNHAASAQPVSQEPAIHKSPLSSIEPATTPAPTPAPAPKSRRDVYRVPSSPDFMHKKPTPEKLAKTYGRSPRSGPGLLKKAPRLGSSPKETSTTHPGATASTAVMARAFQRTRPDEIEPTPRLPNGTSSEKTNQATAPENDSQDDEEEDGDLTASFLEAAATITPKKAQTPARKTASKPAKPGSLKKPSRASLTGTPASEKSSIKFMPGATPASMIAAKSSTKGKEATPAKAAPSRAEKVLGEKTMSRMERLEKLLGASQNTLKRRGKVSSPARSDSIKSQDRSRRSSPEVRVPVSNKSAALTSNVSTQARPVVQSPATQIAPIKSPVPNPPLKAHKSTHGDTGPTSVVEAAKSRKSDDFKNPAAKTPGTPAAPPPATRAPASTSTGTPRRTEVPVPHNVRHLQRGSSMQKSPLSNGNVATNMSSPSAAAQPQSRLVKPTPKRSGSSPKNASAAKSTKVAPEASAPSDAVVISSAESSSLESSDADEDRLNQSSNRNIDGSVGGRSTPLGVQSSTHVDTMKVLDNDSDASDNKGRDDCDSMPEQTQATVTQVSASQIDGQPPSGQGANQAGLKGQQAWGFDNLDSLHQPNDNTQGNNKHQAAAAAPAFETEAYAEQDIYSTAIEDNASGSANTSLRSSPAISRRPARFLSRSPTPDASESEGDSEDGSPAPSRAASPLADNKDDSESESESSSDSSEDDVETPDPQVTSTGEKNARAAPASSPPFAAVTKSPAPATSRLIHQTPIPPPTQHSSQVPHSSQSVSVQAADRRRYTGFRSLREQLADTKAAQATTQKKTFDPRTMSLGKLVKGKPLAGLGVDEDESSDESSSSDSSDDSD